MNELDDLMLSENPKAGIEEYKNKALKSNNKSWLAIIFIFCIVFCGAWIEYKPKVVIVDHTTEVKKFKDSLQNFVDTSFGTIPKEY